MPKKTRHYISQDKHRIPYENFSTQNVTFVKYRLCQYYNKFFSIFNRNFSGIFISQKEYSALSVCFFCSGVFDCGIGTFAPLLGSFAFLLDLLSHGAFFLLHHPHGVIYGHSSPNLIFPLLPFFCPPGPGKALPRCPPPSFHRSP